MKKTEDELSDIRKLRLLLQKKDSHISLLEEKVKDCSHELKEVRQELETFSYAVSHDLQTPLRAISIFVQVLLEDYTDQLDDAGKRYLKSITHSSNEMGLLIGDLLNFARLSRVELNKEHLSMSKLVSGVINDMEFTSGTPVIKITLKEDTEVNCDPNLIKSVWDNLISNAIKYSDQKKKIIIEIGSKDINGEIVYFIKDNGIGFNMKYAHKLFDVFERLHSKADSEGTGVGLSTVQRIVIRHGGRIWAESMENKGATFYFTLAA